MFSFIKKLWNNREISGDAKFYYNELAFNLTDIYSELSTNITHLQERVNFLENHLGTHVYHASVQLDEETPVNKQITDDQPVVQARIHEDDVSGYLTDSTKWSFLKPYHLPAKPKAVKKKAPTKKVKAKVKVKKTPRRKLTRK